MPPIKPVELARQLDVSTSTLRRWAGDFAEHLSESARASDTRRRYTARDAAVLKRAQQLLDAGNTIASVNDLLRLDDFSTAEADQAETAPIGDQATTTALISLIGGQVVTAQADQAQRITRHDATISDLAGQNADLRERVARLEAQVDAQGARLADLADKLEAFTSRRRRWPWEPRDE